METTTLATKTTRLAAAAALALALAGTACTGGAGDGEASRETRAGSDAAARLATAEFDVEGMTCGGCALATEMSVKKLDGVASADAEYDEEADEGRCTVEYDPSAVDTEQIAAAIEEAGFKPTLTSDRGRTPGEDRR